MISVKIVCVQLTRKKVFQQKKDKTTNYLSSGITGIVYVLYLRIKEWNVSINIGSVPNLLQCARLIYTIVGTSTVGFFFTRWYF